MFQLVGMRRFIKRKTVLYGIAILFGLIMGFFVLANQIVLRAANGHIYEDINQVPKHRVGIVLGCSPHFAFFRKRMDAAAELYKAGKVERLLVTGDNGTQGYNEPAEMLKALQQRGVPKEHLVADYAGFRTLDSMVRANKVFDLTDATIITDDFHLARSIFYAEDAGLTADGFPSHANSANQTRIELRELLARGRAILDKISHAQPKYLGKKEIIP